MQTYNAMRDYVSEGESRVHVFTSKCQYRIWLTQDEVSLEGPGVQESAERVLSFDSLEDEAVYFVLLFENGLWPED